MPQKIKLIKLEKPAEYIFKEKSSLRAQVAKLLKDSDWTQLPDSGLRLPTQLLFRFWRAQLRSVDFSLELDELGQIVAKLKSSVPTIIKRRGEKYRYVFFDFDYSSLDSFVQSCKDIGSILDIPFTSDDRTETKWVMQDFCEELIRNGY